MEKKLLSGTSFKFTWVRPPAKVPDIRQRTFNDGDIIHYIRGENIKSKSLRSGSVLGSKAPFIIASL
jgi:hypothetical protein